MDRHLDADLLSDYAEGILDPAARDAADAHLQGCADCRREVAVASAYFREMSGLKPVQAPADFLAKVRARLPSEAPWRRALSAVLRPLRVVPVQLALATLIGITAVTVYVQHGGLNSESVVVIEDASPPAAEAAQPDSPALEPVPTQSAPAHMTPASPEPTSKLLEKAARSDARKSAPRPVAKDLAARYAKAAEESDKVMGPAGSGAATKSRPISDAHLLKGTSDGYLGGIAAADADQAFAREKKSAQPGGQGAIGTRRDAPSPVAMSEGNDDVESLDIPMSKSAPAPASAPAQVGRAREITANAESAPKPAKVASAPIAKAKAEKAPAPPEAAAANQYGEEFEYSDDGFAGSSKENTGARSESRAAAKPKADAGTHRRAAPTEPTSAPAIRQEDARAVLTLKLRAMKDTTALFAGLKSMGVRAEPAAIPVGSPWIRRHLEATPSMLPDMLEYLRRYGYLTGTAGDPSGPAPARIDLLIIKP